MCTQVVTLFSIAHFPGVEFLKTLRGSMLQETLLEGWIVWTPSILMEVPSALNLLENPIIVLPLQPDTSAIRTPLL